MIRPAAFERQTRSNASLGSPLTARVLRLLPGLLDPATASGARIRDWPGEIGPSGASVPLRLLGGLHALALRGDALALAYPPHEAGDAALRAALARALRDQEPHLMAWLDGPPQTNEVRRGAALIAGAHLLAARHGLPLALSEVGASAGLNLHFDRFALETPAFRRGPAEPALTLAPEWDGPPPPEASPVVAERAGCDVAPRDPSDLLRLRAYLWPDQPHRRALTDAAVVVATTRVERADAVAWLARAAGGPSAGAAASRLSHGRLAVLRPRSPGRGRGADRRGWRAGDGGGAAGAARLGGRRRPRRGLRAHDLGQRCRAAGRGLGGGGLPRRANA